MYQERGERTLQGLHFCTLSVIFLILAGCGNTNPRGEMIKYKNISRNSGVKEYSIGPTFIKVRFRESSKIYVYTEKSAGILRIQKMKNLAKEGRGLSTYISQNVRHKYDNIE